LISHIFQILVKSFL